MQDGTFKQRNGRNETGNNLTSTFNAHADKHVFYNNHAVIQKQCTYTVKKERRRVTPEYSNVQALIRVYLTDWRHTHIYTKSKEKKSRTSLVTAVESFPRPSAWSRLAPTPLAWSVSSFGRALRRHVLVGRHHGWDGQRTGFPALSQRRWGNC